MEARTADSVSEINKCHWVEPLVPPVLPAVTCHSRWFSIYQTHAASMRSAFSICSSMTLVDTANSSAIVIFLRALPLSRSLQAAPVVDPRPTRDSAAHRRPEQTPPMTGAGLDRRGGSPNRAGTNPRARA